jgi:hypothetical protein
MDREDRSEAIIGVLKDSAELESFDAFGQLLDHAVELGEQRIVLLLSQEIGHFARFADVALQRVVRLDPRLVLLELGKDGARALVIAPEVGVGARRLQGGYALALGRDVKDSSRGDRASPLGRSAGAGALGSLSSDQR